MRAKTLIGSLILVVVFNICVKAQLLNFNTLSTESRQNVYATPTKNMNNNNVRAQPLRRSQQQNIRVSRQHPFVQQQQQQRRTSPLQNNQLDTIIIIETEPQKPESKPTQRQPQRQHQTQQSQRQQQIQHPQRQQQSRQPQRQQQTSQPQNQQQAPQSHGQRHTQQPQRQQQTQQPQRQQTQPTQKKPARQSERQPTRQPQRQQQVQQQYYNQAQTQQPRPTREDAPVIFPGSTNRPYGPVEQNAGFSASSNPFLPPATAISPSTQGFAVNGGNFGSIAGNSGVNSFADATADGFASASTSSFSTLGGPLNADQAGFNVGDASAASNGVGNTFNGNGINSFGDGQFLGNPNHVDGVGFNGINNFGNNFVANGGAGDVAAPFDDSQWYNPHRPRGNYYRNFASIFNEIDQKAENDYNTSEEDDEMNDDFNGRSVVSPGQYPHMAALGYRTSTGETEFKCGGSLISEMFVLTAAHCCFLNGQAPHLVKIGDIKLQEFEHNIVPQRRGIARVHKHPYYNTTMNYHDIGLLELTNPIEYTFFVRPIRLWARDEIPYNKVFTMGYGSTSFAQAPTNVLTELDLSIVPLETCNHTLPSDSNSPFGITESQICAKDFEKNRDTCQGDSGGPLQLNLERPRRRRLRYYLVGVISYGTFCRSQYPGVYTRVSSYIDWIASIVWPGYFNRFQ